jgi:arylsulfatase A-like enzyme
MLSEASVWRCVFRVIGTVLVAWSFCALSERSLAEPAKGRPPNVIFIMADDLGAECLGCYGGRSYETPQLDRLAASGLRFDHAYCTPLCTPTRVEVMTGQYPFRNGWPGGIWDKPRPKQFLDPETYTFARMFKQAGYATAVAGKWQLARFEDRPNHPGRMGFDRHCVWTWRYSEAPPWVRIARGGRPSRYWDPGLWKGGQLMEGTQGRFGPEVCTEFVLDFIEKNAARPFFVYYPMVLVHRPFVPVPGMEGDKGGTDSQREFAAMVGYMDTLVGRIVSKLEAEGLREKTLLIFTGDNGTNTRVVSECNGKRIKGGKNRLTDAGTRVPYIVSWPGVSPGGKVVEDLIDFTDMLPTFAEVSGGDIPKGYHLDGRSFLPQIRGRAGNPREWVLCQRSDGWFLRTKRYRLHKDGDFALMRDHYSPVDVDTEEDREAARARESLLTVARSLGLK